MDATQKWSKKNLVIVKRELLTHTLPPFFPVHFSEVPQAVSFRVASLYINIGKFLVGRPVGVITTKANTITFGVLGTPLNCPQLLYFSMQKNAGERGRRTSGGGGRRLTFPTPFPYPFFLVERSKKYEKQRTVSNLYLLRFGNWWSFLAKAMRQKSKEKAK